MTKTEPAQTSTFQVRRVITGHDEHGRACIISDGNCDARVSMWHPDFVIVDVWHMDSLPVSNAGAPDICTEFRLEPTHGGNIVRIVRFPPDKIYASQVKSADGTAGTGGSSGLEQKIEVPHAVMHRTATLDCVIILSGEIHAVLEQGETVLRSGDVLVQRGTIHGWSNRSSDPCVMAVILSSAIPIPADLKTPLSVSDMTRRRDV